MATMRCYLILIFLTLKMPFVLQPSGLQKALERAIASRPDYAVRKQRSLNQLLHDRNTMPGPLQAYVLGEKLADGYSKYKVDSAAWYLEQNLVIARGLRRQDLISHTGIKLSNFYSLLGKFREAEHLLETIRPEVLPVSERIAYYQAYQNYLNYYATNDYTAYASQIAHYRDLALSLQDTTLVDYQIRVSEKLLDLGQLNAAKTRLLSLFKKTIATDQSYALTTYLLGNLYTRMHDQPNAKKYFTLSAIADLQNATKDNASMQKLATLYYYGEGDLDMANELTRCALEDAIFSNVRFRMFQVSKFNEEITTAYQEKQLGQKRWLTISLVLISFLFIFMGFAAAIIWRQKRKVERIKNELVILNQELIISNRQLAEANRVKEAYISNFFEWCSAYIDKIVQYRKKLLKKAINKQGDELIAALKSNELEKQELADLYRTFDRVFLNLYPNFILSFGALLAPGELVTVRSDELLSPMLRVFALIRLGITDSAKIASFLRYSASTVYNYRTKGRNMAAGKREDFEAAVMRIGE